MDYVILEWPESLKMVKLVKFRKMTFLWIVLTLPLFLEKLESSGLKNKMDGALYLKKKYFFVTSDSKISVIIELFQYLISKLF